jgi:hypothetical protein
MIRRCEQVEVVVISSMGPVVQRVFCQRRAAPGSFVRQRLDFTAHLPDRPAAAPS